jgi:transposase
MFLRRHRKEIGGEVYESWTLCESVRTPLGPRQRIVATLGKLDEAEVAGGEAGWEELEALLEGRPRPARQLALATAATAATAREPAPARWEEVDLRGVRVENARDFGEVYLGLALWRRLKLQTLLAELIEPGEEEVPWPVVASILTVARFCAQRSELSVAEHWYQRTALGDLLGVAWEKVNPDRLYRGLDALQAQKEKLCAHLMERYRDWFGVSFEFLLYDVTSTFFEGQAAQNEKAARGYSRDSRPDCPQVCIGLVCTPEGLPLSFEVFAGNRTDVTTVEEIVKMMEQKYGCAERVWVMDRGMVSEENLQFLRGRKARYLVGTPKSQLRQFEAALLKKEGWSEVEPGVEARLVPHPDGDGHEQFILCRSAARRHKEAAMLERQRERLCAELAKIEAALQRRAEPDLEAVGRRIGRWLGKYPAAAKLLEVKVRQDAQAAACGLEIVTRVERGRWAEHAHGAYLLRTNCTEDDPAKLWRWYIQLTQAEAAFRTAKSDLGLRPIYHQTTARVEAHILVCFLALALWRTLEMWMASKGLGHSARKLVAEVGTIKSVDVILPVRRGEQSVELRLRVVSRPDRRVAELLAHLGLELPTRSRIIENVVQKIGV